MWDAGNWGDETNYLRADGSDLHLWPLGFEYDTQQGLNVDRLYTLLFRGNRWVSVWDKSGGESAEESVCVIGRNSKNQNDGVRIQYAPKHKE